MPVERRSIQQEQAEMLLRAFEGQVETDPPNWPDVPKGEELDCLRVRCTGEGVSWFATPTSTS